MDSLLTETLENVDYTGKQNHRNPAALSQIQINKETLLRNQSNTFVNTLEKLPGISAIQTGVGISKPVIRGLSLNRVIVTEYGIKQEGQQWGLDHGLEIDQFNVDKVEIIKGPVSILYGADGIGGIINIMPPDVPYNESIKGEVITSYKSNNQLLGISSKIRQRIKNFYYIARFSYQDFGVYRVPADSFIYNNYRLPIYDGYLKNTAGKELNTSLLLGIEKDWGKSSIYFSNFHQKAGFFPGAFGVPRAYNLLPASNTRAIEKPHQIINHFKIINNNQFFTNCGTLSVDLGYQFNSRKEIANPHSHGGITPIGSTSLQLALHTFSAQIKHIKQWDQLKIQSGISTQIQENKVDGYEFLIPNYHQFQIGAYVYGEYKSSNKLVITGGIRYDFAVQKAAEGILKITDANGNILLSETRSPALNKQYNNLTGGLGLSYQLDPKYSLKFNIGSAFRIPIIAELLANGVHHGTFRHEMGNTQLGSEKGILIDGALAFEQNNWNFQWSPFVNYFSNYIYLKPSGRFSSLPEAGQIYQYLGAKTIFWGTEFAMNYSFNKEWQTNASLEYVWNKNLDLNMALPFTPPFSILNELEYLPIFLNQSNKKHSILINGQYFAAQNRTDINEPTTPNYYLINASFNAQYPIGKQNIAVYIQVRNLLNEKYLNNMSRYRILNLPEQGINIQLMLRYQF